MKSSPLFGLIMAGGSGTRLWPRSRGSQPKQFIDLFGSSTMIQDAYNRLLPVIPPERILVATNRTQVEAVVAQIPALTPTNVLAEPAGRDTSAAIGYAAVTLRHRDANALMAVVTADHVIQQPDHFREVLVAAAAVAATGWLVTIGIDPTYAETGYGYIERGEALESVNGRPVYRVARFVEKPNLHLAEEYVRRGTYSWNSGMFVWRVDRILEEIRQHLPELSDGLEEIAAAFGTADEQETLDRVWPSLPKRSIDFGVMEKASQVAVLPADIGWSDVGSWAAVFDASPRDADGNVVIGKSLAIETTGSLIYSPHRMIATVGVEDLIVVDAGDVLLICPRSRAQDVKRIVAVLQERGETGHL